MSEIVTSPESAGRGPLTAEGLCLFHSDLLMAECTLVGRQGCVGCLLSVRNLDAGPVLPILLAPVPAPPPDRREDWNIEA